MTTHLFSRRDEIANAITHGVGALMAIAALILLVVFSALYGSAWHVTSFTIFGVTLTVLYLISTLYHAITSASAKLLFRKFDHMSIFLLIAGTYTPFCLTILRGWIGWILLGTVWLCAIGGVVLKAFYTGKKETLSTILYIVMGWMVIFFIKPVSMNMPPMGFTFLIAGGCFYTVGAYFFVKDRKPFYHSIWHLFVLAGSIFHFFAVLSLLETL